jgi:hypothetical protein
MQVMVLVKANKDSEAGVLPDPKIFELMGKYNEELVKAEVMLAGEGLAPSSKGVRVKFSGNERKVIDGPFPETNQLIAGFWLWKVKSMDNAIERLKPAPFGGGVEIELCPIMEMEDFGSQLPPEAKEQGARLRAQAEQIAKGE